VNQLLAKALVRPINQRSLPMHYPLIIVIIAPSSL